MEEWIAKQEVGSLS